MPITMANNLKHPFEDPPSSPSLSAGEKEIEFVSSQEDEDEEGHQHTIFSSDEDEPEDPPPRSSGESQLSGRKRLSEGISTNVSSKRAKKGEKMGTKKRLFSEKDEIVLLQGIIDSKGKNPLEDKRSFYESVKGSISFDVSLDQFKDKIRHMQKKYTAKEKSGEQASVLNPHQQKCFQLSKAIWGADGVAVESANGKSKKRDVVVSSRKGKNNVQVGSKRRDMKKSPHVVTESDWDESAFFLGMDFLKEKWTKVPTTETKKETQEKMRKLHANELECQKFEDMLKAMKDKCAKDKVELLNEVTSLIMAAD